MAAIGSRGPLGAQTSLVNTPLHHSDFLSIMAKLTYAERLDLERDRDGKPPLTPEERMAKLVRIRDGSLVHVEMCVATGAFKGSASATDMYIFAQNEIIRIGVDVSAGGLVSAGLSIAGLDPALILVNGTGERIEA